MMAFNNGEAVRGARSNHTRTSTAVELDLYRELLAFAELSPEEQGLWSVLCREQLAQTAADDPYPGPVPTDSPEHVEAEPAAETAFVYEQGPNSADLGPSAESTFVYDPGPAPSDWNPNPLTLEPAAYSAFIHEPTGKADDITTTSPGISEVPDPLDALNLTPQSAFNGALSKGVCLACGARAGAEDLFCVGCGIFMDEIAATLPFNPNCAGCGLGIAADELFCPWCGSVLP